MLQQPYRFAVLACCVAAASAVVDKTGRRSHGNPTSRVGEGVRTITVQVGNDADSKNVHLRWDKDYTLRGLRAHLTAKTSWPRNKEFSSHVGNNGVLDSLFLSGSLMDVVYEAHHHDAATDVDVAYDVPGARLMSSFTVKDQLAFEVKSVGAFKTSYGVNFQPTFFLADKRLRLKLGQGIRRGLCPVSVTADFQPEDLSAPKSYAFGLRQELAPGRMLRAKLELPSAREERKVWAEMRDKVVDNGAIWIAKATVPLEDIEGGTLSNAELTLRRAWQF